MLALLLVVSVLAGCGGEEAPAPPSSEEARDLLVEIVALANSAEWEWLCSMRSNSDQPDWSCMNAVEALGPSPPFFIVEILDERVHPVRETTWPSRVLHVCVYVNQTPIETEMSFVTGPDDGRVYVQWPAFWEERWFTSDTSGIIAPKPTLAPGEEPTSPCQPL